MAVDVGVVAEPTEPLVHIEDVVKRFPGVVALAEARLDLYAGEVHALIGENGAGKSSLIKVLSGYYTPDSGVVEIDGVPLHYSVASARSHGVATIHQERQLIPDLTVAENVVLPGWTTGGPWVNPKELQQRAAVVLETLVSGVDMQQPARTLSPAVGQMVEVARGLSMNARILIFDEPTTSLSLSERERLFETIDRLRASGLAILYVSHNLEEVQRLADRITVMRNGRTVETGLAKDFTTQRMVRSMVGRDVRALPSVNEQLGETVLSVRNITRGGRVRDVSFDVRSGEIFALVGIEGSGRTEVARSIFGIDRLESGEVWVRGRKVNLKNAAAGIEAGIGLVPEERRQDGILPMLTVRENISISLLDFISRLGVLSLRKDRAMAREAFEELDIRAGSTETEIGNLSGGNQQKAILARWLKRECTVLLLDEPTKGIDVGAKAEIYGLIKRAAEGGTAIVLISSDLDECLPVANRFGVMRGGKLIAVLDRTDASKGRIISIATGERERTVA
ncbi:sugar ABC transporter ATP-binding protein [Ornithinimicrobium cryptoxanthini]|uniref:Sugar ABC transporter ATP-binding protein n=1 Tax=Ornithinimicrobium cryptoxanthini TaxID=2934161 RepID=A0ABY4YF04_9MICO|nr:sugar ABC transporter ATP-binding protein [Ornithinimicrobium cryptoxanthini]USQ75339.1 sugar ABC transporter ATP-binding protein [Ornithinimicrobium cryptoxanthini]